MLTRISIGLAFLGAAFLVGGCLPTYQTGDPGSGDMADPVTAQPNTPPEGDPSPPPPPADLAGSVEIDAFVSSGMATMSLSEQTSALSLNMKKDITVTINGNGLTGSGTLALLNAPAGFTATFNPATVTLAGAPVSVTMTVNASSNMDPATSVAAMVQLTVGPQVSTTTYGITVMPELMVYIPAGVVTNAKNTTAFGPASIPVKLIGTGTKVTFVNQDGIQHRIHADGTGGLAHEPNNMAANGGTYTQTLNAKGTINFNCHIHTNMRGQLVVQ
jgi:plastocyanin